MSFLLSHSVVLASRLLDLAAEESRAIRHLTRPRYGEASSKPPALSWDRTQGIVAFAQGIVALALASTAELPERPQDR